MSSSAKYADSVHRFGKPGIHQELVKYVALLAKLISNYLIFH